MENNEQRCRELFERWYRQELPEADWPELQALLAEADGAGKLESMMRAAYDQLVPDAFFSAGRIDAMAAAITGKTATVKKLGWMKWAAAAVLLFVVCGLWLVVGRRGSNIPDERPVAVVEDVAPGGNKAVLTLADGTKITLDSAANGLLTQQGDVKVSKLHDGELSYSQGSGARPDGVGAGSHESIQYNTMTTPRGGQYQLTLPDGTKVWLNAASSITYPVAFNDKQRKVKITGEAYFEVFKNKEKPFIVDVDAKQTVEVLGTHFNINSYADEGAIRTTLLEGKVKVSRTGSRLPTPDSRLLKPGEQAIMTDHITVTNQINVDQIMAWKNGLFNVEGADIQAVMRQLVRWYDVDVQYAGKIPARSFGGDIGRDLNLTQVLKILNNNDVHCKLEGRTILVMP